MLTFHQTLLKDGINRGDDYMPIGFKDFMPAPKASGDDEQIKYNAQKRRRQDEEHCDCECGKDPCETCGGSHHNQADEALNVAQRLQRGRSMKKAKARIAMGRRRAARKMAPKDKLVKRARRAARTAILKKLTRDIPKGDLNFARRQEVEKRLDKMKSRIDRLAVKMFPAVRKAEVARKKG